ncbi:hypothetical protein PLICRDRAFT_173946 [Plicaturopsis crispa FD-325 SS-3]|nr:hypothetical protein PLICRDRAFT_173946 [Plicaturopsis crispa FD-325 SS-3]
MLGPAEVAHGPFFIGTVLNIVLYGVMVTQSFLYFTSYKKDKIWLKLFVALLLFADTVNSVFDVIYLYDSLVIHFGNDAFLTKANWVFATDPAMTGIIATFVQLFFAWRVKVLNRKNTYIVIAIVIFALAGCLCSIATSIAVGIVPDFINFQKFKSVVIVWLVSSSICDVIITFSLVWHLRLQKTGFRATDDIVNRIVRVTVQTGLLTAIWAIVDLIVFLVNPTGLHLIFNVPLSKLYTNSLLSSMNARGGWAFKGHSEQQSAESKASPQELGGIHSTGKIRGPDIHFNNGVDSRPEVFVHVEQHEMIEVPGDNKSIEHVFPDGASAQHAWSDMKSLPRRSSDAV